MKVVGIGQCSLDYIFVIDSFPVPDTKKEILEWTICGGGPVATALVTLSRLGIDCSFFGVVGDDESGDKIINSLKTHGIDTRGVVVRRGGFSQIAFISVEQGSGKRTIFWKRPSGNALRPEELPGDFLDGVDFVLLDGLMLEVSLYAAGEAQKKNIPVMLDAGRMREGMQEIAELSDYVVASEEYARDLMGDSFKPEEALFRMASSGAGICTVTLGEKGCMTIEGDRIFYTPAFNVRVVDTTGAGDVFHGGYIYGLLHRWQLKDVVRFASACAALKCRKLGGRQGIPTLEEVQALLKNDINVV
jgi:ribokinase